MFFQLCLLYPHQSCNSMWGQRLCLNHPLSGKKRPKLSWYLQLVTSSQIKQCIVEVGFWNFRPRQTPKQLWQWRGHIDLGSGRPEEESKLAEGNESSGIAPAMDLISVRNLAWIPI